MAEEFDPAAPTGGRPKQHRADREYGERDGGADGRRSATTSYGAPAGREPFLDRSVWRPLVEAGVEPLL